ncbi:MAG: LCP family protein [Bacilli bacterium]|nr:LCP family protein [Bacilli bacterium]
MKVLLKKLKKASKVALSFFGISTILYLVLYILFVINILSLKDVETLLRVIVIFFFAIWIITYLFVGLIKLVQKKYKLFTVLTIFTFIFSIIFGVANFVFTFAYDTLDRLGEKDMIVYTSYLISMKDTEFNENSKIGMISNEDDIEGNILAKEILSKYKLKNDIKKYDDYLIMISDLYNGDVDAIFVSENYVTLFNGEEHFTDIGEVTKIIYKYSEKRKNEDKQIISNKSLTEPFTVLALGVDSDSEGLDANAAFNGDTLILMTFNPKTLTATMFSIPRDTYVPIACRNNAYAKINSSAAYGTSCVIDTIEQLTDIPIDYYIKVNFKAVVHLVDAVGGVTIDVEEPDFNTNHGIDCKGKVCTGSSDRSSGKVIYLDYGMQTLDGEQALAYARNRSQYIESDLARNRHQQEVITALAQKALTINSFDKFESVLDAVSNNIATNMSRDQIISSYDILKSMLERTLNKEEMINIKKTYLEVSSLPVNLGTRVTSALSYYPDSLAEITKLMKENLEIEKPELVKTFSYSINEDYESKVFGKGIRSGESLKLMPSFIGKTVSEAQSWATENNITVEFDYLDRSSNIITNQNVASGVLVKNVKSVLFTVGTEKIDIPNIDQNENQNNETNIENNDIDTESNSLEEIENIMGE